MIGMGQTNLHRLKYLVLDEADILLQKYPKQIRVLMQHYNVFLENSTNPIIAQMVLFSETWSERIGKFIDLYFMEEVILFTSKLEAAFFGNVNHVIHECDGSKSKLNRLGKYLFNSNLLNRKKSTQLTI
jgi:superfamily II DNA/RNA helicase